jgi:hypothetical protein
MLSLYDLTSVARTRLKDAEVLLSKERFDGAAYLCGYAVEIALKVKIASARKLPGFPETRPEFKLYKDLKTHELDSLLQKTGCEAEIKNTYLVEWSVVAEWNPESRYNRPGDGGETINSIINQFFRPHILESASG